MTNLKEEIRSALKGAGMSKVNDDILTKCTFVVLRGQCALLTRFLTWLLTCWYPFCSFA